MEDKERNLDSKLSCDICSLDAPHYGYDIDGVWHPLCKHCATVLGNMMIYRRNDSWSKYDKCSW